MQSRTVLTLGALAIGLLAWPGTGLAKGEHAAKSPSGGVAMSDQDFAKHAAQGGMAEVALGNLALQRAQSPDVKQFAQRMIDDHGKANDELTQLAQNKGWRLPKDMGSEHKATVDRLSKLSGEDFDRQYMIAMVKDHDHDVAAFQSYGRGGKDKDLKDWASKTLPTLEQHQGLAKSTAGRVGASASAHPQRHLQRTAARSAAHGH